MPYDSISDLPNKVKDNLPKAAQEIYQGAFNEAWEEYEDPKERRGDSSREEISHQVAWQAVKRQYKKQNGEWKRKN